MLIYAGKTPAAAVPLDVSKLIAEGELLFGRCLSDGVRLTLDLGENLPPVDGDPSQLHQTVANLVDNAAEALEEGGGNGGHVRVRTRVVVLREEELAGAVIGSDQRPGERVLIEVSDNGPGIDETTAGRIFEPFFSTKFTGRGLGLAVVLGVLRQHRRVLAFESTPGAGTTFKIWLPTSASATTPETT